MAVILPLCLFLKLETMAKDRRLKFYGVHPAQGRRIMSFRVHNRQSAINGLIRMNVKTGWYENENGISERIYNTQYVEQFKKVDISKFFTD